MRPLRDLLGRERIYFDGGTGTYLQARGLKGGELPELWNLTHPGVILDLHRGYLAAGATIFNTNTFGANRLKFGDKLPEIVTAAVRLAKKARDESGREAYVALDLGPTGRLLKPMGDLDFEEAVSVFAQIVQIGAREGADLILIETMSDAMEAKAAVLAAKENCSLPVIITCVFDQGGRLLTGGTIESTVALLEGLRVDALGMNCGLGPAQMVPLAERMVKAASVPVVINPNAGLPRVEDGETVFDVGPDEFASVMKEISDLGVQGLGGCCGTTPDHIRALIKATRDLPFKEPVPKDTTVVTSFSQALVIGPKPLIIGERINPTGKKRFQQALRDHDIPYLLNEGLKQEDQGAHILDVNVGLPEIDEPALMKETVERLQAVTALPLQLDTTDPAALEGALRVYNGKPLINSVNGKRESLETVMPLAAKYGGVLVGLCLDEGGIPADADGRVKIAEKILKAADEFGVPRKDIVIDGLAMTISSDQTGALATLETLRRVRDELHAHTILGVSNISFGLPARELINANFLTMAIQNGLSLAIMNPGNQAMMSAYKASLALLALDPQCQDYIEYGKDYKPAGKAAAPKSVTAQVVIDGKAYQAALIPAGEGAALAAPAPAPKAAAPAEGKRDISPLQAAVEKGMKEAAAEAAAEALKSMEALEVIDHDLIPALDEVGKGYEAGTLFLPQLLMAADAAKGAFDVIRRSMAGKPRTIKARVILATVKGDIHDIGKNIVKVMMENYGYEVIDLGKDVPPEVIVDTAVKEDIHLVGLSALMTTTVVSMEDTIKLLREKKPDCKVAVGGAVMTQTYADAIGADFYGKDAMATVRYADSLFT